MKATVCFYLHCRAAAAATELSNHKLLLCVSGPTRSGGTLRRSILTDLAIRNMLTWTIFNRERLHLEDEQIVQHCLSHNLHNLPGA